MKQKQLYKSWITGEKYKKMKINENKSGILRILKRAGKAKIVENKLNIPELTAYKYLEVQISQSLKIDFHNNFIRQKIASIKRNTQTLKSSLINLKSKMTLYKTVIILQLTNAYHTIAARRIYPPPITPR